MKTHKYHLDLLRIIAVYLVVYNHTGTMGYQRYTISQNTFGVAASLLLSVFLHPCRPDVFDDIGGTASGQDK